MLVNRVVSFFGGGVNVHERCLLQEGSEMIFFYDEGSPSRYGVTLESVTSMPDSQTIENYPIKIEQRDPVEVAKK